MAGSAIDEALLGAHRRELHIHPLLPAAGELRGGRGRRSGDAGKGLLILRDVIEWSAAETAEALEMSAPAVTSALQRARAAMAREDIRITMPPNPMLYEGRTQMRRLFARAREMGDWRLIPVWVNRTPAAVSYLRRPGDTVFRPFKLDVLRADAEQIAEATTFDARLVAWAGLPAELTG